MSKGWRRNLPDAGHAADQAIWDAMAKHGVDKRTARALVHEAASAPKPKALPRGSVSKGEDRTETVLPPPVAEKSDDRGEPETKKSGPFRQNGDPLRGGPFKKR